MLASTASAASAQNYSFDARRIALGGAGGTPNVASKLVERQRRYRSILIPVGMVKVLTNVRVFYPNREDFDFSRAVEFGTSPLHFVFGRREDITFKSFFGDLVRAQLKSDLNEYKDDFEKPLITEAEGLMDVTWGKTFMLKQSERSYQGIYVGAGPYFGSVATFNYDSEFERIVSDTGERLVPNARLGISGGETAQLALDVTGAYRARFAVFGGDGEAARRNGMYVAANYHHLQGFRLDKFNAQLNLDTDPSGLVRPNAPETPFTLQWHKSNKGVGLSMDFGVAFVVGRWDFGTGVSGVANRITWRDITRHELALVSLSDGSEFIHAKLPRNDLKTTVEMPTTYTGDLAYHRDKWSLYTEYSNGLGGDNFRSGVEYRFRTIELRGAGRYSQGSWYPSGGVGVNLGKSFGVDAGLYGTKTFLEPDSHVGLSISLRWDQGRDQESVP